jgi:hypothetical protein
MMKSRKAKANDGGGEGMEAWMLERKLGGAKPWAILIAVLTLLMGGCVVYEPVPAPVYYGSSYDRVWDAAVGAAGDAGVKVTSADRNTGIIQGFTDSASVTISVATQADGKIRVEFSSKGPKGADPDLNDRFTRFYNMRMGRT